MKLPETPTLPAVRVQLIDEPLSYHLRGRDDVVRSLIQVDAVANEFDAVHPDPYGSAAALATAIDNALSGQVFTDGGSPISVVAHVALRMSKRVIYDPDELRQVRIMQDYTVWWTSVN